MTRSDFSMGQGKITVFVMDNSQYSNNVAQIVKSASIMGLVCFISLNKPYTSIESDAKRLGVDPSSIFFIDAVMQKAGKESQAENVVFISSPRALTEMSITVNKVIEVAEPSCVIMDSLSTLLMYESPSNVIKFIHSIVSTLRMKETAGAFIVIKSDAIDSILKDMSMFVDEVNDV